MRRDPRAAISDAGAGSASDRADHGISLTGRLSRTAASRHAIQLRKATLDDAGLLLRWKNDPETRRNSFNDRIIKRAAHLAWLTRRLADPNTMLLIAEHEGEAVGTVRFDLGEVAVVNLTIAPEHRGRGLATPIIQAACMLVDRDVVAQILPHNEASIRAFERAGFVGLRNDVAIQREPTVDGAGAPRLVEVEP